jgi:pimeloyl-ACP methyl ester carboxylesterase
MTVTEERIALDDGASTTLQTWGDKGPVMLCVHGMTSSRRSWERLANHYAGRFRVMAYDQRGHGDSANVLGPMALSRGVRDLENVVAAIGDVETLVGHSWGGAIVILGAEHLPVLRVVGIDPMIRQAPDEWYDEYLVELGDAFKFTGAERDARTREEYADWAPEDVEGKVHAVHSMTAEPIARMRSENPPETWNLRPSIARYEKPLLLAMAAPDGSINAAETLQEIERNHSPNVSVVSFAGEGHNLFRTAFDQFARVMDQFLAQT